LRIAALAFICVGAFGQDGPFRVRGTVRLSGSNQGIAGARVAVFYGPQQGAELTTVTDGNATFTVSLDKPGTYTLAAEPAGGYVAGPEARQSFSIDSEHPTRTANLTLGAPSAIGGRFVDAETGRPIAGIAVQAKAVRYSHGHRLLMDSGGSATSGLDGSFHIDGLTGGEYFLELTPTGGRRTRSHRRR
jgi:fermentation-respiration switch protein FrsA (DUF1100 family)